MQIGRALGSGCEDRMLFFEKGAPTRNVWFYQMDPGRNLGKANPLTVGNSRFLFEGPYKPTPVTFPNFDVSPDGQRFLMLKPVESAGQSAHANQRGAELV
jgi:hypothetical protein